jgi:hypothetical protein
LRTHLPERADWHRAESWTEWQRLPPGVEHEADDQVVAKASREVLEPAEVLGTDCRGRFDIDRDDLPAPVLDDEVDFDLIFGAVVVELCTLP